jgi:glycerophosphoryl diester phosphodiesterase
VVSHIPRPTITPMIRRSAALAAVAALWLVAAAPAPASSTDWTTLRTLNITHQGGEDEAPSGTIYAFARSMRLGADMLEVDIHATADGQVIILHDGNVDRTTDGTGSVYEQTLEHVQSYDAAHDFVPGVGTTTEHPDEDYVFRGVRTGAKPQPRGFSPNDFRIPTLVELMRKYPAVPINIEIKGRADSDAQSFLDNAEALAKVLTEIGRSEGIIVASFNDAAIARFQELMPEIDLAPSIAETAAFKLGGVPPGPGKVAFQVPITLNGVTVTDQDFVNRSHAQGLAVHVWLSNDPENDEVYDHLLDLGVDAVMPAAPAAFERVLCERETPRPPRPAGFPGRHCNHGNVSIACDVIPTFVDRVGRKGVATVRVQRRDLFAGMCNGRVFVRAAGKVRAGRFSFGPEPGTQDKPQVGVVTVKLPARVRRLVAKRPRRATVTTRAFQAYGSSARFTLRR